MTQKTNLHSLFAFIMNNTVLLYCICMSYLKLCVADDGVAGSLFVVHVPGAPVAMAVAQKALHPGGVLEI